MLDSKAAEIDQLERPEVRPAPQAPAAAPGARCRRNAAAAAQAATARCCRLGATASSSTRRWGPRSRQGRSGSVLRHTHDAGVAARISSRSSSTGVAPAGSSRHAAAAWVPRHLARCSAPSAAWLASACWSWAPASAASRANSQRRVSGRRQGAAQGCCRQLLGWRRAATLALRAPTLLLRALLHARRCCRACAAKSVMAADFMPVSIAENKRLHGGLGNVSFMVADVTEMEQVRLRRGAACSGLLRPAASCSAGVVPRLACSTCPGASVRRPRMHARARPCRPPADCPACTRRRARTLPRSGARLVRRRVQQLAAHVSV